MLYDVNDLFFGFIKSGWSYPTRLIVETVWPRLIVLMHPIQHRLFTSLDFFVRCLSYTLLETVPGFGDVVLLVIRAADLPHLEPILRSG